MQGAAFCALGRSCFYVCAASNPAMLVKCAIVGDRSREPWNKWARDHRHTVAAAKAAASRAGTPLRARLCRESPLTATQAKDTFARAFGGGTARSIPTREPSSPSKGHAKHVGGRTGRGRWRCDAARQLTQCALLFLARGAFRAHWLFWRAGGADRAGAGSGDPVRVRRLS